MVDYKNGKNVFSLIGILDSVGNISISFFEQLKIFGIIRISLNNNGWDR